MNKVFNEFKGYEEIKRELSIYADMLNRRDEYIDMGVDVDKGILILGETGTGKTTLANALINATERKVYQCRKRYSGARFLDEIADTFADAIENTPSVVFLDGIDMFSELDDVEHAEEFAVIKAWMDEIRTEDVFVIATARDMGRIPDSLQECDKYLKLIIIRQPREEEMAEIMGYYLSKTKLDIAVDETAITKILRRFSGGEAKDIINNALKTAVFEGKDKLETKDIITSYLKWELGGRILERDKNDDEAKRVVYHEAGHALVAELLNPGSVAFVSVYQEGNTLTGAVKYCRDDDRPKTYDELESYMKTSLAGKAAVEVALGEADDGIYNDMKSAIRSATTIVEDLGVWGFHNLIKDKDDFSVTENRNRRIETLLDKNYEDTKRIISKNKMLLDRLVSELIDKNWLTYTDIQKIFDERS